MRRADKIVKDKNVIREILLSSNICRIAIFDDEFPYIVPLNYGFRNNTLYFHSAPQGKKIDLIKKNNNVGFVIEQDHEVLKDEISCNWTTKYRSVMGTGIIKIVTDTEKKTEGLDIIMQHHGKTENEYNKKALERMILLKLEIKSLSAKQSGQ